jgi:Spy/CpxP family protein refolding chaperone
MRHFWHFRGLTMRVSMRCLPALLGGALLLWPGAGVIEAAQGRPPLKWWKSETFQQDLGITADQEAKIDAIFVETLPQLRMHKDELDRLEAHVSRLIEVGTDEATVGGWIDKAEAARGRLNKVRTLMLMRMRQVLTPDQRARFKALHGRVDRRRSPRDSGRAPQTSAPARKPN